MLESPDPAMRQQAQQTLAELLQDEYAALLGKRIGGEPVADCAAFATALLSHAKVAVVPGNAFMAEGYCRLSYAVSMETIHEGLRRIEAFVASLT